MKKLTLIFLMITQFGLSQVGINTTSPQAQLEIKSSNQVTPSNTDGILIPKIDAFPLTNPTVLQQGMMVYLTTISAGKQPGFYYWDNVTVNWIGLGSSSASSGWLLTGNSGTNATTNFIGTTDDVDLVFKRNSVKAGLLTTNNAAFGVNAFWNNSGTQYNTAIGSNALKMTTHIIDDDGYSNTAIGSYALEKNTIGNSNTSVGGFSSYNNSSGSNNTAIGVLSLSNNQVGHLNIALGKNALERNVAGSRATAIGNYAMAYITDSATPFISQNVAVGYEALRGSTNPTDNTGGSNTAMGYQVMLNNSTGSGNSAVGDRALMDNTTGAFNNAFGYLSLANNTTGSQNNAHGSESLFLNTTGSDNSGFGYRSLNGNSIGSDNTAFGNASMLNNKSANKNTAIGAKALLTQMYNNGGTSYDSNNVAVGYEALYSNNPTVSFNANKNTAIGNYALRGNTIGDNNTANGFNALFTNTIGHSNVATGSHALYSNVNGIHNAANGNSALYSNINGGGNTAFGTNSLFANTNGSNNVAIGLESLSSNISGSGNVAIGNQAGYNETGSNKLYIENSNSTTPLIYGEFDNDVLKVNGVFKVNKTGADTNEMQINNSNTYFHGIGSQNFGSGLDEFLVSSRESTAETGGVYGDGNAVTIWSAGDANQAQPAALVYFLDEDFFDNTNGNPYDNNALKSYISPTGAYVQISDKNKKENIVKIENASEKINNISGYTYQFKLSPEEIKKGDKAIVASGVLAQELEKVLPEAVQKNNKGEYFVDYAAITPLLIEAIKDQNAKIKSLEAINAEILKRLEKLETK